jgi:hypothetical protein
MSAEGEGEPHPMSRGAARLLADRLAELLERYGAGPFDVSVVRSKKELHLIVAALRYYGQAPYADTSTAGWP